MRILGEAGSEVLKASTDTTKRLPLHLLCATAKSVDSVAGLIKLFPEALAVKDADGQLPLHVACSNTSVAATEIVQTVMEAAPEALQCADSAGNLPIHIACQYATSSTLISKMITIFPEALLTNVRGFLPVHRALLNSTDQAASIATAVISQLSSSHHTKALFKKSLAVHNLVSFACEHASAAETVKSLVELQYGANIAIDAKCTEQCFHRVCINPL